MMKQVKSLICCLLILSCDHVKQPTNKAAVALTSAKGIMPASHTAAMPATEIPGSADMPLNTTTTGFLKDSIRIMLAKGLSFTLTVPKGYHIAVAAEGLNRLRFLSLSPDGRLFATDMFDRSDNEKGRVLIFDKWNEHTKRFDTVINFLNGLHNPNQAAFYKGYIYVAETDKLSRYIYHAGDVRPTGPPQVIARFPAYGLSYKYGGWHLTRSLAFHEDKLYVSVGSSCNACIEKEEVRASVTEMNPDGTDVQFYARGLRNSVGIKWIGNQLWATTMGRDLIGPDKPEDLLLQVNRRGYYGWPFYFQYHGKIYADDQFRDSARAAWVQKPLVGYAGFKAHSAPLGFDYFRDFDDPLLKNSILVCLHGSTSVWRERGNAVVKVEGGNRYTDIVAGFLKGKTEAGRYGRPCDVLMWDDHGFFFTDDLNGVLYYVWR